MTRRRIVVIALVFSACACAVLYLLRPPTPAPAPPAFRCVNQVEHEVRAFRGTIGRVFGFDATYAARLNETGREFQAGALPPVFQRPGFTALATAPGKSPSGPRENDALLPDRSLLLEKIAVREDGLGSAVDERFDLLPARIEYGGQLAFVLLDEIDLEPLRTGDRNYAPPVGFLVAHQFSAQSLVLLGEGRSDRYDFLEAAGDFPGFLAVGPRLLIAHDPRPDDLACVQIITAAGDRIAQSYSTRSLLYTPRQLLAFLLRAHPDRPPQPGDLVLTGSGGGTAHPIPLWRRRLADGFGLDRFRRLAFLPAEDSRFPPAGGGFVSVSGGPLGTIRTRIHAP